MEEKKKEENKITNKGNSKNSIMKTLMIIAIIVLILVVTVFIVMIINSENSKQQSTVNTANAYASQNYIYVNSDECNSESNNSTRGTSTDDGSLTELIPTADKPVIYLYPTETTDVTVKLGYPEKLTCTYPKYENEWSVTANPNGSLIDKKTGKELYSLYWEGKQAPNLGFNEGFCVEGKDTAEFLDNKLTELGLNYKEREEFIIYWLPKMEGNKYNLIRFATSEEIEEYMPLEISTQPDTIIRVYMQFKAVDQKEDIQEQKLTTPARNGFVAVEWGGTEIKSNGILNVIK